MISVGPTADAGPRDLGAAGRGKRGHVPYLGGSLGPEKVGQPAAADAPELRAAVRVNRYSPTAPAMAVGRPLLAKVQFSYRMKRPTLQRNVSSL